MSCYNQVKVTNIGNYCCYFSSRKERNDLPDRRAVPKPDGGALHCACRAMAHVRPEIVSNEVDRTIAATPRKPWLRHARLHVYWPATRSREPRLTTRFGRETPCKLHLVRGKSTRNAAPLMVWVINDRRSLLYLCVRCDLRARPLSSCARFTVLGANHHRPGSTASGAFCWSERD